MVICFCESNLVNCCIMQSKNVKLVVFISFLLYSCSSRIQMLPILLCKITTLH